MGTTLIVSSILIGFVALIISTIVILQFTVFKSKSHDEPTSSPVHSPWLSPDDPPTSPQPSPHQSPQPSPHQSPQPSPHQSPQPSPQALANGVVCESNNVCASGYCKGINSVGGSIGHTIGVTDGKCAKISTAGQACTENKGCANNMCGHMEYGKDDLTCCDNGLITSGVKDYCTDRPNGTKCPNDKTCKSGWCKGATLTSGGVCTELKESQANCSDDNQCLNGKCAYLDHNKKVGDKNCCPTNKTVQQPAVVGYYYCRDMPSGTSCRVNEQCASGKCQGGGAWPSSKGKCA